MPWPSSRETPQTDMPDRPAKPRRRESYRSPGRGWYPPATKPLAADGIRARSRRGEIGETWWSRRFIEMLESFDMGARLTRGRRYARAGQVLELEVEPGEVTARVQGSRRLPYAVRIGTLTLSPKDWARVEEMMASRAVFLAKLLAGEMPHDIEQAFAETRLSLFPVSAGDLSSDCSCPDWANPCKHIAAAYYLLAEAFDADPFLIFRWRGRDRDELLTNLVVHPAGAAGPQARDMWDVPTVDVASLADSIDRFWEADGTNDEEPHRPRVASIADGILRGLEPGLIDVAGQSLAEVLAPAYRVITTDAERTALGEEPSRADDPDSP